MPQLQFFNSAKESIVEDMNLGSDSFKWMLTNTAPVATNSVPGDLTEIAAGNGYAAGGSAAATTSSSQTGGTYSLVLGSTVFTAAGGSFAAFRYIVLVNTTVTKLIGWLDYGTSYTLPSGQTFTVPAGTAFTLA